MTIYEDMLAEAGGNNLVTKEKPLRSHKGRIKGNRIAIRKDLTSTEKTCVLAEELGHYYTTVGNILDQDDTANRKQEQQARLWAYNKLIGLVGIVSAYKAGCRTIHDMADHLDVTEEFLTDALDQYREKYGLCATIDNYIVYFEPHIAILELKPETCSFVRYAE